MKNEHPENIINQTIDKFISRITLPNQPKPQKENKRFIVLPFVNKKAEDFAVRLKSLAEESCDILLKTNNRAIAHAHTHPVTQ